MKQTSGFALRTGHVLGLRDGKHTTLIKWAIVFTLNLIGFILASLVSPPSPPQERAIWAITQLFPGGLSTIGELVATMAGNILNWRALGYLVIANAAATLPLLFGAQFVRQLYRFDSLSGAMGYLIDAILVPADYHLEFQPGQERKHPHRVRGIGGIRAAQFMNGILVPAGMRPRNQSVARAGGPGAVVVPPEYAVQLERDGRLGHVAGPGVVRLSRFERVYKPVRLRQIVRKNTATAHTRDGIPVTVEMTIRARVRASAPPTKKNPYPFDRDAVTRLIVSTPAGKSGPVPWEEQPSLLAGKVLNDVLGKYRLDELLDPLDENIQTPSPTVRQEVWHALRQRTLEFGLEITDLWMGEFQLPAEVIEQYLAYWQADWQRQKRTRLADSQVSRIRRMNLARAEAQKLTIETLISTFQSAQASGLGTDQKELVAQRLIDTLEQLYRHLDLPEGQPGRKLITLEQHLERLRKAVQPQEHPEDEKPLAAS